MSEGKLEKANEISAFGLLVCCVGIVWTWIVYMSMASSLMELQSKNKLFGFAIIVPIWQIIEIFNAAKAINLVIEEKDLKIEPANEVVILVLLFVFAPISFFLLFKKYNEVVDAIG